MFRDIESRLEDALDDANELKEKAADKWGEANDAFQEADEVAVMLYSMIDDADKAGILIGPAHDLIAQYRSYLEDVRDIAAEEEDNWDDVVACIEEALEKMSWM